ncbi:hypothetical protein ACPF8X_07445 [Streptomyces sp. G35A]
MVNADPYHAFREPGPTMIERACIKQLSPRLFTRSPRIQVKRLAVSRYMTKASTPGPLAPDGGPSGPTAAHELSVGPYLYTPAAARPSTESGGTLSRNGVPVELHVTEALLTNVFAVVQQLESDLAGRWVGSAGDRAARRPDESIVT